MEQEETTDLTTIGDIQGTMERPKSLDPDDLRGTEDIREDEIQLPRLAIAQGLSPQLVPGEGKFIRGLTIGEMFNDITEEIYGTGPLTVVPVKRHVTRIEFDPNDKKVPVDRDVPYNDPRMKWSRGTGPNGEDEPPRATEFVEFICLLLRPGKPPEPVVVSIKTTNKQMRDAARKWTTYIATRGTAIHTGMYKLSSKIEKGRNKKGEDTMYGVFIVKNAGFVPADMPAGKALLAHAAKFQDAIEGKTIVTDREAGGDDADTDFDTAAMDARSAPAAHGQPTDM